VGKDAEKDVPVVLGRRQGGAETMGANCGPTSAVSAESLVDKVRITG
jgi:hypothetical protein